MLVCDVRYSIRELLVSVYGCGWWCVGVGVCFCVCVCVCFICAEGVIGVLCVCVGVEVCM